MFRTFGPVAKLDTIEDYGSSVEVVPRNGSEFFRVVRRDGRIYQQRFERNADGREVRQFELEVTHAIGSGRHARSYLHLDAAGELVELPLTWYTQEHRWGMSPGYDRVANPRFSRVADAGCLFCHMAYPASKPRYGVRQSWTDGLRETGIDCERCHGPGDRHVQAASNGATGAVVKQAIVNPAKLPRQEGMDVCLQCHLQTTSSGLPHAIRRFGRDVFSFRPGEKLSNYVLQFDHPPEAGRSEKFEVNGAGYRLMQSRCFLQSGGRLTCTTCHSPHGNDKVAAKVCLDCHKPHADARSGDCTGCHMPKRRTEDAVHVVLTDHRIQRGPVVADLTASRHEKAEEYRGNVRFLEDYSLPGVERSLYEGMALVEDHADLTRGITMLRSAIAQSAKPPVEAQVALARALGMIGKPGDGFLYCASAVQANPRLAALRAECAKLLEQAGQNAPALEQYRVALTGDGALPTAAFGIARLTREIKEAARLYRIAAASFPIRADALTNLGSLLLSMGKAEEARPVLEEAVAIDPFSAAAENNLARLTALTGDLPGALVRVQRALQLDPDLQDAHFNLAQLLYASGKAQQAIAEYRELIRRKPSFVEAHLGLGNALADEGELNDAVTEFRTVLRLQPSNREAADNLKAALALLAK